MPQASRWRVPGTVPLSMLGISPGLNLLIWAVCASSNYKYAEFMRASSGRKIFMARVPKKTVEDTRHIATSVRFEPAVKAAIDKAAREDTRSTSSLIQKVMADWLKANGYLK